MTRQADALHTHSTRAFSYHPKAEVLEMFTDGGAAVAVGDFDGDGWDDVFLTDSDAGKPNHLLRNLTGETGDLRFADVAAEVGVAGGNDDGAIVADALWLDYDNDGRRDLLVARFGSPLLYRNTGSGADGALPRLEEVSERAGLADSFGNTIAAIAFDADGDGWLDLLLGHYFPPRNLLALDTPHVLPNNLDAADNGGGVALWRNVPHPEGGRRFEDVTAEAGLAHHTGWTLDLGHGDLDDDGDQDLYLAGDYGTDRLLWNDGDGTFTDGTEEAIGFDTRKGMNVDLGDYNRDGWLDVYVTNITDEYMRECNMLWHNNGDGTFLDLSRETGTCDSDWGWAAKWADLDNDGWEDIFTVNGLRSAGEENYIPVLLQTIITPGIDFSDVNSYPDIGDRTWSGYQVQRLFHNRGDGTFAEVAAEAGVDNDLDGRGIGVADFDHDGRLDLFQTNARQRTVLYRNVSENTGHWLGLRLEGRGWDSGEGSNRDAIGARVTVNAGGVTWVREVDGGNGYASQSTRTIHVGLGGAERIDRVEIRWPSGRVESRDAGDDASALPVDTVTEIVEGAWSETKPTAGELAALRNLGKALYENPATQYEAVEVLADALAASVALHGADGQEAARDRVNHGLALLRAGREEEGAAELRRAQELAPELPHTWFNLGIAAKRASRYDDALDQLRRFVELVPDDPIAHYNLGVLHKIQGDGDAALAAFERAAELDPYLAGARFQLASAYRQAGRAEAARDAMAEFRELKALQADDAVAEDLEWSFYSELVDPREPRLAPAEPAAEPRFETRTVAGDVAAEGGGRLTVLDADGDGTPDLLLNAGGGLRLLLGGTRAADAGLGEADGVHATAVGDLDNDGLPDLALLVAEGVELWRNIGGTFAPFAAELPESAARPYRAALWLDVDRDYDVDLLLLGDGSTLLRNAGEGVFQDHDFPFAEGTAIDAVQLDLVPDMPGLDLVVSRAGAPGVVHRDLLGGRYVTEELPALPAGATGLVAVDLDHDGWTDLAAAGPDGPVLLRNLPDGGFAALEVPAAAGAPVPVVFADLENRGSAELVAGATVVRNRGADGFGATAELPLDGAPADLAAADFDADGRVDLAAVTAAGDLVLLANRTASDHHWLAVDLTGVKNMRLAPGAEVEVKAGASYQKQLFRGVPLHFGLGPHASVDTVRVTWPNGLIQNEPRQETGGVLAIEEAQRLSGSCPMVFTWNGRRMEFISDVLGVAPLGAAAGDGVYFQVDHTEYLAISGDQLVPRNGVYDVRLTEELREVGYLDQIRLLAVDHPAGVEVLHNDKFKGPPYPEFRLYGVDAPVRPVAARDLEGRDVLPTLLERDRTYPDGFERNYAGLAEHHGLVLDFASAAPDGEAILVLHGWVDWADGSTFMATAQDPDGPKVELPRLQVRDATGAWRTVVADMGVPAGKPKTIVVDLTGLWLSDSREIRILTSLVVYWDEIYLGTGAGAPEVRLTELAPARADLRFRGFSGVRIHPQRRQPEWFVYDEVRPASMWNPTPGTYTRYGEVAELLDAVDDRFVVFGAGDELALEFDAAALPPLPPGWERDFLLFVDGWAKDGDHNTAHGRSVEPLPHHGMPEYPYGPEHAFPDTEEHREWREEYQTRPALRLIRPLHATAAPE